MPPSHVYEPPLVSADEMQVNGGRLQFGQSLDPGAMLSDIALDRNALPDVVLLDEAADIVEVGWSAQVPAGLAADRGGSPLFDRFSHRGRFVIGP